MRTHKYAHALVATQSRDWCDAARLSWRVFKRSGVDGIIDDDVTDRLLLLGGYAGGSALACLYGLTAATPGTSGSGGEWAWLLPVLLTFALGFSGVTLPLTVLEASASTLFVTYAQVPEVLAQAHPILFHRYQRLAEVYAHARGREAADTVGRARDDLVDDVL